MRLGTLLSSLAAAGVALAQSVTNTTGVNTLSSGNSTVIPKKFIIELAPVRHADVSFPPLLKTENNAHGKINIL